MGWCVLVLFVVPAYADGLTLVLTFSATGPTEAEAKNNLWRLLAGVVSDTEPGPAIGEMSAVGQAGHWKASGNVAITGSPADLVLVEDEYGGLADDVRVTGDGPFGPVSAGSVYYFSERAGPYLTMAAAAGLAAAAMAALGVWARMLWFGAVFGGLFGVGCLIMVVSYLAYAPYAL